MTAIFAPGVATDSYTPDKLVLGGPIKTRHETLTGSAALDRGTLLGRVTLGAASKAAKSGGNAANTGDMTLDVTTPILANAQVGVYTVRCISTASNGGTFRVTAPDGTVLGDVAVAATFANHIKFVIADGSLDFIVGEGFDVTIAAGSGKMKKSLAAAVDGSQVPVAILVDDADATGGDVGVGTYVAGEFNEASITFGSGHTAASVRNALREIGIHLRAVVA
jgi:hypothetical protein